jgi:hypothetical protein
MTAPEAISTFLRLHTTEPYCDICIAASLALSRHQAEQVTSALATQDGFVRERAECSLCRKNVLVIQAV